jgi:FixJ family two-component response regulator
MTYRISAGDGADDYLIKPVQLKDVLRNLRRALEGKRVEREVAASQRRLEQLLGERTEQLQSALQIVDESYENTLLALGAALPEFSLLPTHSMPLRRRDRTKK